MSGFAVLSYSSTPLQPSAEQPAPYAEVGLIGVMRGSYPSARTLGLENCELVNTAEVRDAQGSGAPGLTPSLFFHQSSYVFAIIFLTSGSQMSIARAFYRDDSSR